MDEELLGARVYSVREHEGDQRLSRFHGESDPVRLEISSDGSARTDVCSMSHVAIELHGADEHARRHGEDDQHPARMYGAPVQSSPATNAPAATDGHPHVVRIAEQNLGSDEQGDRGERHPRERGWPRS